MKYTEEDLKAAHEIVGGRIQGLRLAASSIEKEIASLAHHTHKISI
jgi:hypothetical protein